MKYYDSQNNAHILAERIGSGGEGTVYFVDENRETVAKIYHEPIEPEKIEKLRWMAANKSDRLLKVSAWVVDVLYDAPGGKVVGFLMPSVKAKEIHELYSLKSRRVYFPEATWHFLVHTAANVARAFYNLHGANHIMGDVNHGNCVVLADGTVKLIDCDSYSIKTDKLRYPCEVGVATHLAPELQGADLSEIERETKHDNFGLAVIIFQLLFLGRHPFAGKYLGAEDKSIEDCIRELRFAYGKDAQYRSVQPPPGTLPLAAVGSRVAEMFEKAFLTENRPEPREWIEALEDLANNLEQCALHPGHLYFNNLATCPWCEIELQTGLMLFPFVAKSNQPEDEKTFNIFTIENLIASFGISNNLPAKPLLPVVAPVPSEEVLTARKKNQGYTIGVLIAQLTGILFLMMVFGNGIALFIGIGTLIFWLSFTNSSFKYLREDLEEKFSDAQRKWSALESQWAQKVLPPKIEDDLSQIKRQIGEYQKFQHSSVQQHKNLLETISRRQLHDYLRSAQVADANIYGVREKQIESLLENNFRTAADMDSGRLRYIPTIGKRTIEKLIDWRKGIEKNFVPDISGINLEHEKTKLAQQNGEERRRIERSIEQLFVSLRAGAVDLRRRRQELVTQATEFAKNLAQTKSDIEHLGTNTPVVVGLVLITFLTPYIGFVSDQMRQRNGETATEKNRVKTFGGDTYSGIISAPLDKKSVEELEVPDEKITDQEIATLSYTQRSQYAVNLYEQATDLIYDSQPNYKKAERKMRLAVRLQNEDPNYLNQLANVLFEQGRYNESLEYLTKSLKIDNRNQGTRLLLAKNYIKTNSFNAALPYLVAYVNESPDTFDGNYLLGLTHAKLKHYEFAVEYLKKATNVGKDDADAHYQLAVCYHQIGDQTKAESEYDEVVRLNSKKAEKLADEIRMVFDKVAAPPPPAKVSR